MIWAWLLVVVMLSSVAHGHVVDKVSKLPTVNHLSSWSIPDSPACPPLNEPSPDSQVRISGGNVNSLVYALRNARPGTTIQLEDGVYHLPSDLALEINTPFISLRGTSGHRDAVEIQGGSNALIVNADGFTVADLTISQPRYHAIQVRGERGVKGTIIYRMHLVDAGQQFVKISAGKGDKGKFSDDGLVACSLIEYSDLSKGNGVTPGSYTNGVDVLAGEGWVIRDNVLKRIRSEKGPAGPAILAWKNAIGTVIKRNLIIDSWRGIALGLMSPNEYSRGGENAEFDHQDGLVENNVILALNEPCDAAIENNFASNSFVIHNTVYYHPGHSHAVRWAIEYRYETTTVAIRNNLTNLPIQRREPRPLQPQIIEGNITQARMEWFQNIMGGNAHLTLGAPAIDHGIPGKETIEDMDGTQRPIGETVDVGADEFVE